MMKSQNRRFKALCQATNEPTKSKAIDRPVGYYLRMRGNSDAYPNGAIEELFITVDRDGSVSGEELASILDCPELPVEYRKQITWSMGDRE